jgi:hypothetical protein
MLERVRHGHSLGAWESGRQPAEVLFERELPSGFLNSCSGSSRRQVGQEPKGDPSDREPQNAAIGIGIATTKGVLIVEMNHVVRRKFGTRPLEDFFAPEHAQVIMDALFAKKLGLRGILEGMQVAFRAFDFP